MKLILAATAAALAFTLPAPLALADDDHLRGGHAYTYSVSRQQAIGIARSEGMHRLKEIERDDGEWEIEGCTREGYEFEIDIDGRTGRILDLEIDYDDRC